MSVESGSTREYRACFNSDELATHFNLLKATPEDFVQLLNSLELTPLKTSITFSPKEKLEKRLDLDLSLVWNPDGHNFIPRYLQSRAVHYLGRESQADFDRKVIHNIATGGQFAAIDVDIDEDFRQGEPFGFDFVKEVVIPQLLEDGYEATSAMLKMPTYRNPKKDARGGTILDYSFSRINLRVPKYANPIIEQHYHNWWEKFSDSVDPRESTAQV